jgi:integrase
MPRLAPDQLPAYRLHRQSGQAIVTLSGRDFNLGPHGSPESRRKYDRPTGEWVANGRRLAPASSTNAAAAAAAADSAGPSQASVAAAYWTHAERYYAGSRGELGAIKAAIRILVTLYPDPTDGAARFGPLALKRVREDMIRRGWCRNYVNAQTNRLRRLVKWAVENELAPPAVLQGLQAVAGLRAGKSPARESDPVRPVPENHVAAVCPHVSPQVRAMIELQLVTGMRPGEVCAMRGRELDTAAGRLWTYKPARHKTAHHGYTRLIYLGPRAQQILRPFLKPADPDAYLFSPAEADRARRTLLTADRTTPRSCGNRPGDQPPPRPPPQARHPLHRRELPDRRPPRLRPRLPRLAAAGRPAGRPRAAGRLAPHRAPLAPQPAPPQRRHAHPAGIRARGRPGFATSGLTQQRQKG